MMKHADVLVIAEWLKEYLLPHCKRIEIVGSVRRGKADVHDMELLAVPLDVHPPIEFGRKNIDKTFLDQYLRYLVDDATLRLVKGGDKYKQFVFLRWEEFAIDAPLSDFHFDLFIVTPPAEWGVQSVIRTGPSDFSHWMVTKRLLGGALPDTLYVKDGAVWDGKDGSKYNTPEEEDFFQLCGMEWIEPGGRVARWKNG